MPTANIVVSRSSGLAPLGIHFDGTGSTSSETTLPFHELYYLWNFGDGTSSGTTEWTYGNPSSSGTYNLRSKNIMVGPIAYHVYESAGTYTVTLTVFDGVSSHSTTIQITVTDWANDANTICVSSSGTPVGGSDGVPSNATCVNSSDWAAQCGTLTNKRILFRHDDTFSSALGINLDETGPWYIGMYGSGARPILQISGSDFFFALGVGAGVAANDGRLVDLDLDGGAGDNDAILDGVGNFDNLLLLRIYAHNLADGVDLYAGPINVSGNDRVWDDFAMVSCTLQTLATSTATHGAYIFADRFSMIDTLIDDTASLGGEHLFRAEYLTKSIINHCKFSNSAAGKEMIGLRGVGQTAASYYFSFVLPAPSETQYVVISDCEFAQDVYAAIDIGPVNDVTVTVVKDIIIERNYFDGISGSADGNIWLRGERITNRNNIFDTSNLGSFQAIYLVQKSTGMAATVDTWVYNNTCYSGATPGSYTMVNKSESGVGWDGSGLVIKNNLAYVPGVTGATNVTDATATEATNSTDSGDTNQIRLTAPGFSTQPPTSPPHYQITAGSYAIGTGSDGIEVFDDYYGNIRDWKLLGVGWDIGAHAYTTGTLPGVSRGSMLGGLG